MKTPAFRLRVDGQKRRFSKTIRIRYIKMHNFLKTEKKVSIFKNIRIRVEGASAREKKFICMKFCSRCLRCKLNTARGEKRWRCFCAFGGWKATSCYCRDQNGQAFKQVKHYSKQLLFSKILHSAESHIELIVRLQQ